jgi:hypothetical protein
MRTAAAEGDSVEVLECLQQQGFLTSTAELTKMLNMAASKNNLKLDVAKYLKKHGAEWPTALSLRYWKGEVLA